MVLRSEINLKQGEILYREGSANECAFIIESGEVVLFSDAEGRRVDVERRGPGAIIGELSILTGLPRAVTVEATCACRMFRISAEQILALYEKLDPVLRACVETSISFSSSFTKRLNSPSAHVPLVPSTLRNADQLIEGFQFEQDILTGIDEDQFFLMYQPIVRIHDQRVVGFESLMRWSHPKKGIIPTDLFIDVAETCGSISRLTDFAMFEACAALGRLRQTRWASDDIYTSVNVSGSDIGRVGLVEFVSHLIDMNGLSPRNIRLEVTEPAMIPDFEMADRNYKRLQELGFGVSIDDFGTGYSNLAYLKKMPLTALKIDRSFAGDARLSDVSSSIVRFMVGLGRELGVDVIAEGVETMEDVVQLQRLGCTFAQGYYFHRPLAENELVDIFTDTQATKRGIA